MQLTKHEETHNALLRKAAAECTVLLKKDGAFPLSAPCKIALYGNGARHTVKGGTGSGGVNSRFYVTAEQGLERAGFEITTKDWLDGYDAAKASWHKDFVEGIKKRAQEEGVSLFVAGFGAIEKERDYSLPIAGEGDTAVYVLSRVSGEGNDRTPVCGDVLLTDTEVRDILEAARRYPRFMLVLNVGGVVDLSPVAEAVPNILVLSQLGVVTGDILADVLLGKANPSGKLTTTWAAPSGYCDLIDFGDLDETRYREGIYVGYRWFDSVGKAPLYPFGYGLSYTDFQISFRSVAHDRDVVTVLADVTNTGGYAGKEVVQLYVSAPQGRLGKPYQALAAFQKTQELAPGQSACVSLTFALSDLSSYDEENAAYVLENGSYALRIGSSSRNTQLCAAVILGEDIVVRKGKNCLGKTDFADAVYPLSDADIGGVPSVSLTKADFCCKTTDYHIRARIHPLAEKLSDEELCYLCVGAYDPKVQSGVVGNSAVHVCGAAGETTNHLKQYLGDRHIVMADGPAGLRLSQQYIITENGLAPVIKELADGLGEFVSPEILAMVKKAYEAAKQYEIHEQFTTAIPIATAVAQSWNVGFAELCGDIVGSEMEIYHVHLWLAPAMNIHRSILCGRNFEYYSEDPVLSGAMAAAVTKGVQKHPGRGATIKHFAANNQENNRYNSNSIVSERAMREIYLRAFEFCIRESDPAAVMTSYNLLNGTHTSECYGLVTDVLRGEWEYSGFVMTDWVNTGFVYNHKSKYPPVYTSNIVKAGNDITMAGGQGDYDDLLNALRSGKATRQEVLICASRILYAIDRFNG